MPKGVYPHNPVYKDKPCAICGFPFSPNGPRDIYCPVCKPKTAKEQACLASKRFRERGGGYNQCPQCGGRKQVGATLCQHCSHKKLVGAAHPGWKGGRRYRKRYVQIWTPQGYVLEHRQVWEQTHNKKVPENYVVHHLNGIPDDNRPENLVAVSCHNHEYQTLLKLAQKRIRELEQLHLPL